MPKSDSNAGQAGQSKSSGVQVSGEEDQEMAKRLMWLKGVCKYCDKVVGK